MRDLSVVSGLAQLKTLVAGLYGRIDSMSAALGATPAPNVDFIVDLFDRADMLGLGDYWSNPQAFSVSGNRAVATGTVPDVAVTGTSQYAYTCVSTTKLESITYAPPSFDTPAGAMAAWAGTPSLPPYVAAADVPVVVTTGPAINSLYAYQSYPRSIGKMSSMYSAKMRSRLVTIKLTFDVTGDTDAADTVLSYSSGYYSLHTRVEINQPTSFGIAIDNSAVCGYATAVNPSPATGGYYHAGPDGPWYMDPATLAADVLSHITFGGLSPTGQQLVGVLKAGTNETGVHYLGSYSTVARDSRYSRDVVNSDSPVVVGTNVVLLVGTDTGYTITINGSTIFSATSPLSPSRERVGIASFVGDALAAAATIGITATGITSFKAWRNDIPEPPDQSGHGTYVEGSYVYIDKYHPDDGAGGYTYSPAA